MGAVFFLKHFIAHWAGSVASSECMATWVKNVTVWSRSHTKMLSIKMPKLDVERDTLNEIVLKSFEACDLLLRKQHSEFF